MQLRKEIGHKKELTDIMLSLPLGLKNLIEYMPLIFKFIQESFYNKDESNAIKTLTHWVRAVSSLNDIIDPIISPSLSELSYDLLDTFQTNYANRTKLYGTIFWLICKLGPKCRSYNADKMIRTKNNAETGMKIFFKDKDQKLDEVDPRNVFHLGVEDIVEQNSKNIDTIDKTIDNLKSLVLFYINKNSVDVSLINRCIQNILKDNDNRKIFGDLNPYREFENVYKPLCELDSKIPRRNQIRSFEFILRMIFAVFLMKDQKGNTNKITELAKFLTRHFTLIYICKNGTLKNKFGERLQPEEEELLNSDGIKVSSDAFLRTALNEINPLIFIDILCELFHEGNSQTENGPKIVLNEIFCLLKKLYPSEMDYALALRKLEFIDILYKKICCMAYNDEIEKKTCCISAISILLEQSPQSIVERYNLIIMESILEIIKSMMVSYGRLPNKLITNLLLKLAKKNNYFIEQYDMLQKIIIMIFTQFKDMNCQGRRICENFLDLIRKAYAKNCALPTIRSRRNMVAKDDLFPPSYQKQLETLGNYLLSFINTNHTKLDILIDGYSSIETLIADVDITLYLLKHDAKPVLNQDAFIILISQLIEVMEYEIEVFNDTITSEKNTCSTKFMLIEKLHISNNKVNDIYSSTKYPHRLFNFSFEKKEEQIRYITKGSKISDDDLHESYYNIYLEKSLEVQLKNRSDYDTYLNEIFPNYNQHIELMILILHLFSSSIKVMEDFAASKEESEKNSLLQLIATMKYKIEILMMACVIRIESKLSDAAEKNLLCILDEFKFSEKIYEHLELILDKKMISHDTFYKEIGIIKLFSILYKKAVDVEKLKKLFESAVDGIKCVESEIQQDPPGVNTINHCRFVYEMVNIFISVNWFANTDDQIMRLFDRKVYEIATNMHKKVIKIPCSGSDLIDKSSFKQLICKYMNGKNTWGNHWQVWLQGR